MFGGGGGGGEEEDCFNFSADVDGRRCHCVVLILFFSILDLQPPLTSWLPPYCAASLTQEERVSTLTAMGEGFLVEWWPRCGGRQGTQNKPSWRYLLSHIWHISPLGHISKESRMTAVAPWSFGSWDGLDRDRMWALRSEVTTTRLDDSPFTTCLAAQPNEWTIYRTNIVDLIQFLIETRRWMSWWCTLEEIFVRSLTQIFEDAHACNRLKYQRPLWRRQHTYLMLIRSSDLYRYSLRCEASFL